jgi:hypothetical protein
VTKEKSFITLTPGGTKVSCLRRFRVPDGEGEGPSPALGDLPTDPGEEPEYEDPVEKKLEELHGLGECSSLMGSIMRSNVIVIKLFFTS